ncbi:MAG: HAD family phosphatase [Actinobacteria bacterium]|nr:HAD family phosphatase [Actinomycetota bacterium]
MLEPGSARAVLWDLGGVLLQMDWAAAGRHWEAQLGLPTGDFLRAVFGGSDDTVLVGRVPEQTWWGVVRVRLRLSPAGLEELRADLCRRQHLDEDLFQMVRQLRGAARQAVISNAWPSTRGRLSTDGLEDLFDEVVISAEVGVAKPAAGIFRIALDRLGVGARECVFVDDSAENIEAARALGIPGHLHTRSDDTAAWLRVRLGLSPGR